MNEGSRFLQVDDYIPVYIDMWCIPHDHLGRHCVHLIWVDNKPKHFWSRHLVRPLLATMGIPLVHPHFCETEGRK